MVCNGNDDIDDVRCVARKDLAHDDKDDVRCLLVLSCFKLWNVLDCVLLSSKSQSYSAKGRASRENACWC
jgi:hypothetical protein